MDVLETAADRAVAHAYAGLEAAVRPELAELANGLHEATQG